MSTIAEPSPLELVVATSGLDPAGALALKTEFTPFFVQAEEWSAKIATVTDPKIARASRLVLKGIRVEADHKRASLKETALGFCRTVEAAFNTIEARIKPMEATLLEIETAAERAEQARRDALKAEREKQLALYIPKLGLTGLGDMPDADFDALLSNLKVAHEAKIEAARRAEADRLAREQQEAVERAAKAKADAEERERLRIEYERELAENERLRKEAAAREESARIEREKAERARVAAAAKAKKEREAVEAKAAQERRMAEAAAKAERDRLADIARAEREARERLEAEAKAVRDREAARQAKEAEEAARAAAAPDREKLVAFALLLGSVELPEMTTAKGKAAVADIAQRLCDLTNLITGKASSL